MKLLNSLSIISALVATVPSLPVLLSISLILCHWLPYTSMGSPSLRAGRLCESRWCLCLSGCLNDTLNIQSVSFSDFFGMKLFFYLLFRIVIKSDLNMQSSSLPWWLFSSGDKVCISNTRFYRRLFDHAAAGNCQEPFDDQDRRSFSFFVVEIGRMDMILSRDDCVMVNIYCRPNDLFVWILFLNIFLLQQICTHQCHML